MNRYLIGKGREAFGDRMQALASTVTMASQFNRVLLVDWDDPFWPDASGGFYRYFTLVDQPYVNSANQVPAGLEIYPAGWRHGPHRFEIDEPRFPMAAAPSYDPREGFHREPVWVYGGFGAPAGDYQLLKEHLRLTPEAVEALSNLLEKIPAKRPVVSLSVSGRPGQADRWNELQRTVPDALLDTDDEALVQQWLRRNPGATALSRLFGGYGQSPGDRFGAAIRQLASFLVLASAVEAYSLDERHAGFVSARAFGLAGGVQALFSPVPDAVSLPSAYPGFDYQYRCGKVRRMPGSRPIATAAPGRQGPDAFQAILPEALLLHRQGDFDAAERLFKELLAAVPAQTDALHMLGVIACQRGDFPGAADLIGQAIAADPRHAAYHSDRGYALQLLGRFEEALEHYDRALSLDPGLAITHLNRGDVLTELNRPAAAGDSYGIAETILRGQSTDAESLYRLGVLERRKGNLAEAVELFSQAMAIRPEQPSWHLELGLALQELRRYDEALMSFDRALSIDPLLLVAQLNRGHILRTLGNPSAALESDRLAAAMLAVQPENPESLHILGAIEFRRKRCREALSLFDRSLALDPGSPPCLSDRGLALQELRRYEEALESYEAALRLDPGQAITQLNRGNVLRLLKREVEAERSDALAAAILETRPDDADSLHLLGLLEYRRKNLERASDLIGRAISINPHHAIYYSDRGFALQDLRRFDAALECYDKALSIDPDLAVTQLNRANVLREFMMNGPALESYARAKELIEQQPRTGDNLHLLGVIAFRMRDFATSIKLIGQAIELDPGNAGYYSDQGLALQELARYDEALKNYEMALTLDSGLAVTHFNRAITFRALKRFDIAFECYEIALSIKPDYWDVYWNKSLDLLLLGEFAEGFELYEWRWKRGSSPQPMRNFPEPFWLGKEQLEGRTILLHSEQGLGDSLQFCRYVKMVKALGATVILEVDPPLLDLLRQVDGADRVIARGEAIPPFDLHCPLLSLPLAFRTRLETIPSGERYLFSNPERREAWAHRLGQKRTPRVGIAWSGRAEHLNDHNRSMPLDQLLGHLPEGIQYFSLQKEVRPSDMQALLPAGRVLHFGELLVDFTDTAALCDQLDLVVTIDTSVAHLAAALGKPVWIMLPFIPDWRWLLDREESPWYPTVRLYRQGRVGDWSEVYRRIREGLERFRDKGGVDHG